MGIQPQLTAVFGSENRVRVLVALAGARRPISRYEVAKRVGINPVKAYEEVKRLREAGAVLETESTQGTKLYRLADDALREYFRLRVRVSAIEDIDFPGRDQETGSMTAGSDEGYWRFSLNELERTPEKDRLLRRAGLRPSNPRRRRPVRRSRAR